MRGGRRAPSSLSVGARPLHRDCRRAACTPVAQVRRAITSAFPRWVAERASHRPLPGGRPPRPRPVAATAGARTGDARGAEGGRIRYLGRAGRRAATSPGCRRAACMPVALVRWAIPSGWPKSAGSRCHNALSRRPCRRPVPAPAARCPSPRPPGGRLGMRGAEGARSQGRRRAATSPGCPRDAGGRSAARRPRFVAATAGVRMGMRAARRRATQLRTDRRGLSRFPDPDFRVLCWCDGGFQKHYGVSIPDEERYSARKASTGLTLVAIRAGR
jgi:hypothetical protein